MKLFSSKRRKFAAAALILLFLFLLRPGASRLKSRIIYSISWAVGRPVDIGSVHLRFLPRPGFDLENFVVYDDPAFGAEPILRASEVTAALRLTSLFRGHLEIAQLDLTEPSLNLVHGENGRWNLESLLERTAHAPTAPTAKPKFERRPGFPYIQATSARINFKNGQEKKPYALTNADFSLWQESDNSWGLRLKAQPFRTDLNLNDIGLVRVEGTWQRADNLRDTPLQLTVQWSRAQLGQATKFFSGNDQGWRGSAQVILTASGTPADLKLAGDFTVDDFRRFDITRGSALRFAVHCAGNYLSTDHVLHELACRAPAGKGSLALNGEVGLPGTRRYDLSLRAENVPVTSALALVERVKKNLPDDLTAEGSLDASFVLANNPATSTPRFVGDGKLSGFQLASASTKSQLGPETIPFALTDSSATPRQRKNAGAARNPAEPAIEIGPFPLALGRTPNPSAHGRISRTGYSLSITGDAEVSRTLRLARLAGLPTLQAAAEGAVQLDLQVAGFWAGWMSRSVPTTPQVTGSAKLRNVRVALRGADEPVEILSAELQLAPDLVRVNKLVAHAADAAWTGSLSLPRGCGTPSACEVHFDLDANQLSLSAVSQWANPSPKARPWYRMLEASTPSAPSWLASLRASGQLHAGSFRLKNISASQVSADVSLDSGVLEIDDLSADVLGGTHTGSWQADFTAKPAVCTGSGKIERVALAQLAPYLHDPRLAGSADAAFDLKADCRDFWPSAEGKLQFDVRNGILSSISLNETEEKEPLRITRFAGAAHLLAGKFDVSQASLDSPSGKFQVTGTASFARELDLKLRPVKQPGEGYAISGTLTEPRVLLLSHTEQAKLKTEPTK